MNNRMISFGLMMTMDSRPSSSPPLKMLTITLTMLLESSMTFCWCKLCDEPHDPNTCEYILVAKEVVEGHVEITILDGYVDRAKVSSFGQHCSGKMIMVLLLTYITPIINQTLETQVQD